MPTIPITFRMGNTVLNYFSMVTTVGTSQTVLPRNCGSNQCSPPSKPQRTNTRVFLGIGALGEKSSSTFAVSKWQDEPWLQDSGQLVLAIVLVVVGH